MTFLDLTDDDTRDLAIELDYGGDCPDLDSAAAPALMPDGSLSLEPGSWPDGEMDATFNVPIMLTARQTHAISLFFRGSRVQSRIGGINEIITLADMRKFHAGLGAILADERLLGALAEQG